MSASFMKYSLGYVEKTLSLVVRICLLWLDILSLYESTSISMIIADENANDLNDYYHEYIISIIIKRATIMMLDINTLIKLFFSKKLSNNQ